MREKLRVGGMRVKLRGGETMGKLRGGGTKGSRYGNGEGTDMEGFDTMNGCEGEFIVGCTQFL